jgi:hypothetical protein
MASQANEHRNDEKEGREPGVGPGSERDQKRLNQGGGSANPFEALAEGEVTNHFLCLGSHLSVALLRASMEGGKAEGCWELNSALGSCGVLSQWS